jgi:hypothetical protein
MPARAGSLTRFSSRMMAARRDERLRGTYPADREDRFPREAQWEEEK